MPGSISVSSEPTGGKAELGGKLRHGRSSCGSIWCAKDRLNANLLGQPGHGTGVGQVGCDDVRGCPGTGQILRQTIKRLPAAAHQGDGVTLSRVATGDSLAGRSDQNCSSSRTSTQP
jgi:hypothetical protein